VAYRGPVEKVRLEINSLRPILKMKRLLKAIAWVFGRLPLPVALALGQGLGWLYGSVIRFHRRDAWEALRRSLPEKNAAERAAILSRMYRNLGMNLVETLRLAALPRERLAELLTFEGAEHLHAALARGRGVLVLSAHIGNWDLLCTLAPYFNYPTTIITKEIRNRALNELWMETRRRFGLKFAPAHHSYRQCLHALRNNEIVGFILDQNMIRDEGVFVDFFGQPACTTPGLAFMSAQSRAPVVPVFILRRKGGRHLVRVSPLLEPPPDRRPETIREYTQRYTRIIEDVVRQYPEQWIWIHRRWRTVPQETEPAQRTVGQPAAGT